MKTYTIAIHVERLKKMLTKKDPFNLCPVCKYYNWGRGWKHGFGLHGCDICTDFIGIGQKVVGIRCPCHRLGESEAIKRTFRAIEKYETEGNH